MSQSLVSEFMRGGARILNNSPKLKFCRISKSCMTRGITRRVQIVMLAPAHAFCAGCGAGVIAIVEPVTVFVTALRIATSVGSLRGHSGFGRTFMPVWAIGRRKLDRIIVQRGMSGLSGRVQVLRDVRSGGPVQGAYVAHGACKAVLWGRLVRTYQVPTLLGSVAGFQPMRNPAMRRSRVCSVSSAILGLSSKMLGIFAPPAIRSSIA